MCGIAGIYHFGRGGGVDPALLDRMNGRLRHRGPDDAGTYVDGRVGLAMRRLSIIDLSTGRQPMTNEDGSLWIVFNGEVYNFQALRRELEGKGHPFKTRSDTEAILHLYEEMGPDCVKRLRGMFAFSLWDARRRRLLLARDRMGKKPLVYALGDGRLAWASELGALLELPDLSREVEPQALDQYLSLGYIPSPWTVLRSVRKLPAAHRLVFEKGEARVERYWDLPRPGTAPALSVEEAKEAVREKLREAVRLRMVSDVPLGAFLSGGIDSSCVVALMSRMSDQPVRTFSIGFEEETFSELPYAREVANRFGTRHTEFVVRPEMAELLPRLARQYGEPYADSSALPTFCLARETRRHVTVALNGDGGDEAFGGYRRYLLMKWMRLADAAPRPLIEVLARGAGLWARADPFRGLPSRVHRFMEAVALAKPPSRYLKLAGLFTEDERNALYAPGFRERLSGSEGAALRMVSGWFEEGAGLDLVNRLSMVDYSTYLPDCLMPKVDIASMAHSLEARSPFLDHELVEFAFLLPGRWKLKGMRGTKWILREAMRDLLPAEVVRRGKMGFGIPVDAWFREGLRDLWQEHVLSPRALARGYFQERSLRRLWKEHLSGWRSHGSRLWALLMLELWHRACLDGEGP